MKTNRVIALTAALVLVGMVSLSYARYVEGFEVVGVSEGQVTIQKGKSDPFQAPAGKKNYKVGDQVDYDSKKLKVRNHIEGC